METCTPSEYGAALCGRHCEEVLQCCRPGRSRRGVDTSQGTGQQWRLLRQLTDNGKWSQLEGVSSHATEGYVHCGGGGGKG